MCLLQIPDDCAVRCCGAGQSTWGRGTKSWPCATRLKECVQKTQSGQYWWYKSLSKPQDSRITTRPIGFSQHMYKKPHLGSWKSKQDNYVKFHWLLAEELIFTAMPDILVELVQSYWGAGLVQSCRMFSYGPSGLGWMGLTTAPAQHKSHLSQDRQGP